MVHFARRGASTELSPEPSISCLVALSLSVLTEGFVSPIPASAAFNGSPQTERFWDSFEPVI